jgi:DNA-binding response OmpR family regulator
MARIMIIEDDERRRSLLKYLIEQEGHEIYSSSNNWEAFGKLAKNLLILLLRVFESLAWRD